MVGVCIHKLLKRSITPAIIFLSCFVLSFTAGSFIFQPKSSKAVTGLTLVSESSLSLFTDTNTVNLTPTPSANNGLASGAHTLITTTNVPTGYQLALSGTNPATGITSTPGTITSPTALTNNTWGFALTNTSATGIANGFDPTYDTPIPSLTSKWANPSTTATIKNTSTSATNDNTDIYYGTKVDMTLPTGTYSGQITYTATANISTIPAPSIISITPTSGTTAGGTAIEIIGTNFTVNDQSITTTVTLDNLNCNNVSISSNTPTTGQDTIYCDTPAHPTGAVNLTITTWGGTTTATNGYTYITPPSVTFVSPNIASATPGTESGPAFTIVGTNFTGATSVTIDNTPCETFTIISDTQIFCKSPNTITTTGKKAIIVTKNSLPSNTDITVAYTDTNYPTLQATNAYAECTTTAQIFRDERDSQLYYTKKMPDQKCWLIDNLKYANYGTLSQVPGQWLTVDGTSTQNTQNSDIAKYTDPGATTYCTGTTDMPADTITRCGLLYNWYTATAGTGTYSTSSSGTNLASSICPANFRLPSSQSGTGGPTTNGTSIIIADLPVLNASMNAGTLATGDTSTTYSAGWQPTGAWSGIFSGVWDANTNAQGSRSFFWSSTALAAASAYHVEVNSTSVSLGYYASNKLRGLAVRCVMDAPLSQTDDDIQTVTTASCPTTKIRVIDARDDATYWIQKLADGKCWMLTNLAYGGGGANTYGDVKTIYLNTTSSGITYTSPEYYIPPGANRTTGTTDPSVSIDGGATNPQYGYSYNWCAAMGNQTGTAACVEIGAPDPDINISICPNGWRLPTSGTGGEIQTMTDAIGATTNGSSGGTAGSTALRSTLFAMYNGVWNNGFSNQGINGNFWSSTPFSPNSTAAYYLGFNPSLVNISGSGGGKYVGYAVRCLAAS